MESVPFLNDLWRRVRLLLSRLALMEVALDSSKLDELFEQTVQTGYTKELLFSNLVKIMSLVVCSVRQSIGSVYKAMSEEIGVSKTAVYDKQGSSRTLC